MHRSRLGTIVIDCQGDKAEASARFWAAALGWPADPSPDPAHSRYCQLKTPPSEVAVIVQAVDHASRVHIDIETDDIEAEVSRLVGLGAKRVSQVRGWWVMEAPTGQRFCVVRPQRPDFAEHSNRWEGAAG